MFMKEWSVEILPLGDKMEITVFAEDEEGALNIVQTLINEDLLINLIEDLDSDTDYTIGRATEQ